MSDPKIQGDGTYRSGVYIGGVKQDTPKEALRSTSSRGGESNRSAKKPAEPSLPPCNGVNLNVGDICTINILPDSQTSTKITVPPKPETLGKEDFCNMLTTKSTKTADGLAIKSQDGGEFARCMSLLNPKDIKRISQSCGKLTNTTNHGPCLQQGFSNAQSRPLSSARQ